MQDVTRRRWLDLCAEAAICEDPQRLSELTAYIVELLKEEQGKLDAQWLKPRAFA
jgi:hypothetical protein